MAPKAKVKTREKLPTEDKIVKIAPFGPGGFVDSINLKQPIDKETVRRDYTPFIINKNFSNTVDTVFLANEINKYSGLDEGLQYDFLYHSVDKKKRFGPWQKAEKDLDADIVMEYYGYSRAKAMQVLPILRPFISEIKRLLYKGGRT